MGAILTKAREVRGPEMEKCRLCAAGAAVAKPSAFAHPAQPTLLESNGQATPGSRSKMPDATCLMQNA
jgi:hypothetical protein